MAAFIILWSLIYAYSGRSGSVELSGERDITSGNPQSCVGTSRKATTKALLSPADPAWDSPLGASNHRYPRLPTISPLRRLTSPITTTSPGKRIYWPERRVFSYNQGSVFPKPFKLQLILSLPAGARGGGQKLASSRC